MPPSKCPLPDTVIAVMAYGRAGSGLWSSLFDSHPNLLSFPDCVIMDFYSFWERLGHRPAREIAAEFVSHYSVAFDASQSNLGHFSRFALGDHLGFCTMGPNKDQVLAVDAQKFLGELAALIDLDVAVSRRLFFQAIHVAYARALGREFTDPVIVFGLHVSSEVDVRRLMDDFPRTVVMQTVREPVKGIASWFRHFDHTGAVTPDLFVRALGMALDTGRPMPKDYHTRWFAVRLEDVHARPEMTMQRVASWLGLAWSPSLLLSTFNGLTWWNEKRSIEVSGFSTQITAQTFDDYLSAFDRWRLSAVLGQRGYAWGYSTAEVSRATRVLVALSLLFPFRMEAICRRAAKSAPPAAGMAGPLAIYWQARWKMLQALFSPNGAEAAVLTDPAATAPSPDGRSLLIVGGSDGTLATEFFAQGQAQLARGETEAAIASLTAAITLTPNIVQPYAVRADAYRAIGNIALANVDRGRAGLPPFPA